MIATLTWTKQRPTVAGWYFWRNKTTQDMGVIRVDPPGLPASASPLMEWAGPIAEPKEPTG